MTLFDSLKQQGILISQKMDTKTLLSLLGGIPFLQNSFKPVFSMVNQLQSYYDTLLSADAILKKAQDNVKTMQNLLEKAKDAYDMILNTPSAYVGAGVGKVAVSPLPTLTSYYAAITIAQKNLDVAEKALDKAQERVDSIKQKIENYKDSIVQKLINIKVV